MTARDSLLELKKQIGQTVLGQDHMIERLLIGLLANGNLLVEGLPGLAKTRAIKKLAKFLDAGLSRIQFTPDLLPPDITGSEVYRTAEGKGEFRFQAGPVLQQSRPLRRDQPSARESAGRPARSHGRASGNRRRQDPQAPRSSSS